MSNLHRWLLAFYSALVIGGCAGVALLAWEQNRQLDIDLNGFRLVSSITSGNAEKWAFLFLVAVIAAFALLTLLIAVFPPGQAKRGVFRLRQPGGGVVEVTSTSLETVLRDELGRLPDVREVTARVSMVDGVIQPDVSIVIEPAAQIAHVAAAVVHVTVEALRERVGITEVRRPGVHVTYQEWDEPEPAAPGTVAPLAPQPLGVEEE